MKCQAHTWNPFGRLLRFRWFPRQLALWSKECGRRAAWFEPRNGSFFCDRHVEPGLYVGTGDGMVAAVGLGRPVFPFTEVGGGRHAP